MVWGEAFRRMVCCGICDAGNSDLPVLGPDGKASACCTLFRRKTDVAGLRIEVVDAMRGKGGQDFAN